MDFMIRINLYKIMTQIIISGCPRSGTTALKDLLNTQRNTCITNELEFYVGDNASFIERLESKWFNNFSRDCKKKNIDSVLFRDHILHDKTKTVSYLHSLGYQIVGDKFPGYIMSQVKDRIIQISKQNIKFIFCVRDCRDFISSSLRHYSKDINLRTNQWVKCTIHEACAHWVMYNKGLQELIQHIPSENHMIVQYEKAVKNNAKLIYRINKLTEGQWVATPEETVGYYAVHVDAWKTEYPDIDKYLSEDAFRLMELFGYDYD